MTQYYNILDLELNDWIDPSLPRMYTLPLHDFLYQLHDAVGRAHRRISGIRDDCHVSSFYPRDAQRSAISGANRGPEIWRYRYLKN